MAIRTITVVSTRAPIVASHGQMIGLGVSAVSVVSISVVASVTCGTAVVINRVAVLRFGRFTMRSSAASASAKAVDGRAAGFFAKHDITSSRTDSSIVSGNAGGASLICAMAIAIWVSPVNGREPRSAS